VDLVSVEDEVDEPASGGAVVDAEERRAAGEEVPRVREAMELRTEKGSYLRLIDSCITQLKPQGPSRTCNESKAEEEEEGPG